MTRYEDCRSVLSNTDIFASDWRRAGFDEVGPVASMQELDPPEHVPIRRLFTTAFRARDLTAIGRRALALTESIVAGLAPGAAFDFTADVARPVALDAVCALLGIDPPPAHTFAPLADALVRGMDAGLLPEVLEPAMAARAELNDLIAGWFAGSGDGGLLAQVLAGADAIDVSQEAVWNSARVLFLAGFSTTVGAAANAVLALLHDPEAQQRMRDPELLESGVDELMRYDGPVQGTSRACVEDVTIGEVGVRRGQLVLPLFAAANRDPQRFPRPDDLVLDRRPNQHLALGWGPHSCSGAMLARIVLRALIRGLWRGSAWLRLAGDPERVPRATLRYPDRLPVVHTETWSPYP
ncbi:cytochrome P450 [Lentzea sp. NBRC 105346]|uniref:cytochrome P450 n=1 Tax=Lentzea sp. NBRC 105346 TaxID=3032205 RepID=UPI0025546B4B|nr:cytochrome P450 [Lentzea sp. NBRC 105346]